MTLPGYDAWLTHDPRDRDYGPCETCGHSDEDHADLDRPSLGGSQACTINGCECQEYIERNEQQRAEDAAIEKWENRRE